jgi:hypothetical protein
MTYQISWWVQVFKSDFSWGWGHAFSWPSTCMSIYNVTANECWIVTSARIGTATTTELEFGPVPSTRQDIWNAVTQPLRWSDAAARQFLPAYAMRENWFVTVHRIAASDLGWKNEERFASPTSLSALLLGDPLKYYLSNYATSQVLRFSDYTLIYTSHSPMRAHRILQFYNPHDIRCSVQIMKFFIMKLFILLSKCSLFPNALNQREIRGCQSSSFSRARDQSNFTDLGI